MERPKIIHFEEIHIVIYLSFLNNLRRRKRGFRNESQQSVDAFYNIWYVTEVLFFNYIQK